MSRPCLRQEESRGYIGSGPAPLSVVSKSLYVCMCACIYIYIHIVLHIHLHVYIYICTHVYLFEGPEYSYPYRALQGLHLSPKVFETILSEVEALQQEK